MKAKPATLRKMASTKPVQLDYLWKAHLYKGTESSNSLPSAMQVWVAVGRLKCCIHAEAQSVLFCSLWGL
jgi:hypothetical protein